MIAKLVNGALGAVAGAVKVVIVFGVLVGLVVWAKANPDAWQALVGKMFDAAASIVNWICDQIINLLGPAGSSSS